MRDILRLAAGEKWRRGHHVTEQALVAAFGVSRSPVRAALKVLEARGLVEARPNQGYFLLRAGRQLGAVTIEVPRSAEDDLYLRIVADRCSGALGEMSTQADLLRRYRVNRSVLAVLLGRMADEGLVERLKGHGWRFLPTLDGIQSQRASYAFRLTIEPAAMLLPEFELCADKLAALRDNHLKLLEQIGRRTIDRSWIYDLDASFHETLASFSNNAFFTRAIQQHNRLRRLIEYSGYGRRERVKAWAREHLAVIDALSRGHRSKAAQLMRQHLLNALNATVPKTNGRG